jgi:uncharacterized XkdX family phage protein
MFNSIKRYYDMGKYTNEQVKIFVMANWITAEQYKEITGEDYEYYRQDLPIRILSPMLDLQGEIDNYLSLSFCRSYHFPGSSS